MQVSKEIITEWLSLREVGDNNKLAKILKMTPQNVSKLLHSGDGTVRQISKIQKFFKARKIRIAKIENDLN